MNSSLTEIADCVARRVVVAIDALAVVLAQGRTIAVLPKRMIHRLANGAS